MISSIICEPRLRRGGLARAAGAGAALIASSFASSAAFADAPKNDPVAAQALFTEARALVEAGNYAAGCPKFEASLALQPSASTLINIARCHEHDGKLASAWSAYNRALALNVETKGAERKKGLEDLAKKGIAALEPRLPKIRILLKTKVEGLKVTRDGAEIPAAALDEALPADPGPHEIQASAPGYKTESRSVTLEEGKTITSEITLTPSPVQKSDPVTKSGGGPGPRVPLWAWIAGAGGLALSGVAVYFLADDLSAINALKAPEHCSPLEGGGYACDPRYDYAADNARKNRDLPLFIAFGAAGVLALGAGVGGIVHGMTSRSDARPAAFVSLAPGVWLAPGGGGATLTGRF